jgi:hypothetical protein
VAVTFDNRHDVWVETPAFIHFVDGVHHLRTTSSPLLYFSTNRRHGPYLNHTRFWDESCGVVDSWIDFSCHLDRAFSHNLAVPGIHHLADCHYSDGSRHHYCNPRVGTAPRHSLVVVDSVLNSCHEHHDRHDLVHVHTKSFGVFSTIVTASVISATAHCCVCMLLIDALSALAHQRDCLKDPALL